MGYFEALDSLVHCFSIFFPAHVRTSGGVCRFFLQGRCKFGDRCRDLHPGAGGGGGPGRGRGGKNSAVFYHFAPLFHVLAFYILGELENVD